MLGVSLPIDIEEREEAWPCVGDDVDRRIAQAFLNLLGEHLVTGSQHQLGAGVVKDVGCLLRTVGSHKLSAILHDQDVAQSIAAGILQGVHHPLHFSEPGKLVEQHENGDIQVLVLMRRLRGVLVEDSVEEYPQEWCHCLDVAGCNADVDGHALPAEVPQIKVRGVRSRGYAGGGEDLQLRGDRRLD
jgi:hypothetical protein